MSSEKPTLPSIQLMLEGAGIQSTIPFDAGRTNKPGASYHRRHASDVVGHLENLTLSTPTPLEPNASSNRLTAIPSSQPTTAIGTAAASHNTSIPNWPSPFRPTPLYQHPYHHHRSARNLHSRSYSDYTHPYLTTPPTPAVPAASQHGYLTPQHRRTVSTSTLDSMIHHQHQHLHRPALDSYPPPPALYPSHSTSTLSQSPTLSIKTPSSVDDQLQHPPHHLFDTDEDEGCDDDNNSHDSSNKNASGSGATAMMAGSPPTSSPATTDDNSTINNKYQCPYCQKGFSRPSSLRIHTYSHTGEKPFTCPEPNCDRAFSVQSNMRRHIRVHKLNGKHLKMRRSPPPIKPLAAKPSWMPLPSN